MALLLFALFLIFLYFWIFYIEPHRFELTRYRVILPQKLKRPIKILHLSDSHFAKPKKSLERFFDQLALETVDLIFLTGDILDCAEGLPVCLDYLKKFKPAMGFFAVFGNHDYYDYHFLDVLLHDFRGQKHPLKRNIWLRLREALKGMGVQVLRNETVSVQNDRTSFFIHGVDDSLTGHADLTKIRPEYGADKVNILITHSLDVLFGLSNHEIDMSFSGHTHGGQVCFPLIGPIFTHTEAGRTYAHGMKRIMKITAIISKGLGSSRYYPMRLLCRPEAGLVTLESKESFRANLPL